jgi:hypothetical protein
MKIHTLLAALVASSSLARASRRIMILRYCFALTNTGAGVIAFAFCCTDACILDEDVEGVETPVDAGSGGGACSARSADYLRSIAERTRALT